jgi:glycosyltransferase involved in cell wall biosynthesis
VRRLDVICPVYNEEAVIADFWAALRPVLDGLADRYTACVTFVVDWSSDRTVEILRGLAQEDRRLRVLAMSSRFGHQMALVAGMDHASGDAVVMLDSDLQHPPSLIPVLLERFEAGHDIVFTVRTRDPGVGAIRRWAGGLFYDLFSRLSETRIDANASDFRLISKKVCDVFRSQIRERNQFLRGLFSWVGFRRASVEFTPPPRPKGASKYSVRRLMRFALHGVTSFSKVPLQLATFIGLLSAGFGLLLAVVTFVQYFIYASLPSGWTTLVIINAGFNGVTLIFLGVIGEYIAAIFDETKARPHYIIDQKINFDAP